MQVTSLRPVVQSFTSTSAISPTANQDMITISTLSQALTINTATGVLVDGQKLLFRIRDNGTSQTISWNTSSYASYRSVGADLTTSTTAGKWQYIGCIYNVVGTGTDATPNPKWDVIVLNIEL
jgi:hypothetical protein